MQSPLPLHTVIPLVQPISLDAYSSRSSSLPASFPSFDPASPYLPALQPFCDANLTLPLLRWNVSVVCQDRPCTSSRISILPVSPHFSSQAGTTRSSSDHGDQCVCLWNALHTTCCFTWPILTCSARLSTSVNFCSRPQPDLSALQLSYTCVNAVSTFHEKFLFGYFLSHLTRSFLRAKSISFLSYDPSAFGTKLGTMGGMSRQTENTKKQHL